LQERGVNADVANLGIPGYSTEQTLIFLEEVGWSLQPDLLVVGNLWSDNNFDLYQDAAMLAAQHSPTAWLLQQSALLRRGAVWADQATGGGGSRKITWTAGNQDQMQGARRVPLQDYAKNLDLIAHRAAEHGCGVVFLALANTWRVETPELPASWDAYFAAQKEVASHLGSFVVDARIPLAMAGDASELFVDTLHPSGKGFTRIAQFLAAQLISRGWPDSADLVVRAPVYDPSGLVDPKAVGFVGKLTVKNSPMFRLFGGDTTGAQGAEEEGGRR
jgi:lysophospholipase L1-like esterase